jgi:hypothetical protein
MLQRLDLPPSSGERQTLKNQIWWAPVERDSFNLWTSAFQWAHQSRFPLFLLHLKMEADQTSKRFTFSQTQMMDRVQNFSHDYDYTPYTIHHTLYTIHYTPYTIHHTPYTIHHTLYTIHYTPYTIHHTLYTILSLPIKQIKAVHTFTSCVLRCILT